MHYDAEVGSINGYKFYELIESTHFEVMQYTGLKDKNGKEIYEGDIIQYNETKEIHTVKFISGGFIVAGQHINELYLTKHWKVIGNIYENSELLQERKENETIRF